MPKPHNFHRLTRGSEEAERINLSESIKPFAYRLESRNQTVTGLHFKGRVGKNEVDYYIVLSHRDMLRLAAKMLNTLE